MMSLPTPEQLQALLRYEPETGELFWRERSIEYVRSDLNRVSAEQECRRWNARHAGKLALTSKSVKGYRTGCVLGFSVGAHRVVWAIYYGAWPSFLIDHRNNDPADNRIVNLRPATPKQNARNRNAHRGSASGLKGVTPHGRRWKAVIWHASRPEYLGLFATPEEAGRAYDEAAVKFYGDFAKTNYPIKMKGVQHER